MLYYDQLEKGLQKWWNLVFESASVLKNLNKVSVGIFRYLLFKKKAKMCLILKPKKFRVIIHLHSENKKKKVLTGVWVIKRDCLTRSLTSGISEVRGLTVFQKIMCMFFF